MGEDTDVSARDAIKTMVRVIFMHADPTTTVTFHPGSNGKAYVRWKSPAGGRTFMFIVTAFPSFVCEGVKTRRRSTCRNFYVDSFDKQTQRPGGLEMSVYQEGEFYKLYLDSLYFSVPPTPDDPKQPELRGLLQSGSETELFNASRRRRDNVPSGPLHVLSGSEGTYAETLGPGAYGRVHARIAAETRKRKLPQLAVVSNAYPYAQLLSDMRARIRTVLDEEATLPTEVRNVLGGMHDASDIDDMARVLGSMGTKRSRQRAATPHPNDVKEKRYTRRPSRYMI